MPLYRCLPHLHHRKKSLQEEVPRGNNTLCCLVTIKLNRHTTSKRFLNYYSRKVCTMKAGDVEWIECKHVVKTDTMLQLEKQLHLLSLKLEATSSSQKRKLQKQMKYLKTKLARLSTTRQLKLHPKTNTITVEVKSFYASKTKSNSNAE